MGSEEGKTDSHNNFVIHGHSWAAIYMNTVAQQNDDKPKRKKSDKCWSLFSCRCFIERDIDIFLRFFALHTAECMPQITAWPFPMINFRFRVSMNLSFAFRDSNVTRNWALLHALLTAPATTTAAPTTTKADAKSIKEEIAIETVSIWPEPA